MLTFVIIIFEGHSKNKIDLQYSLTSEMIADIMTKTLAKGAFTRFRLALGLDHLNRLLK